MLLYLGNVLRKTMFIAHLYHSTLYFCVLYCIVLCNLSLQVAQTLYLASWAATPVFPCMKERFRDETWAWLLKRGVRAVSLCTTPEGSWSAPNHSLPCQRISGMTMVASNIQKLILQSKLGICSVILILHWIIGFIFSIYIDLYFNLCWSYCVKNEHLWTYTFSKFSVVRMLFLWKYLNLYIIWILSYFESFNIYLSFSVVRYSHTWTHGDYIMINSKTGGIIMLGRSDGTLNPNGVRFGSAEIYNIGKNAW